MGTYKKKRNENKIERQKKEILDPEGLKKEKKGKVKKVFKIIGLSILGIILVLVVSFLVIRAVGKASLAAQAEYEAPNLAAVSEPVSAEEKKDAAWQEGWVKYNGKIYTYNEDIRTFLIMGIDKDTDVIEMEEGQQGGQADALFLAVMNPHDSTMKFVAINRNSMAEIDFYDEHGAYITTGIGQIALQHGYGNGLEESCEYQVNAVSKMFYELPIHGYAAINMKAIPTINDMVGGVTLTSLENIKNGKNKRIIKEGEEITLKGDYAYWYLRDRNTDEFGSADLRLSRQKQYIQGLMAQIKKKAGEEMTSVLDIYGAISKQMVTNISFSEVTYLAPEMLGYSFDFNSIIAVPGETVMGDQFEEYIIDQKGLYELIMDVFYEEVELD